VVVTINYRLAAFGWLYLPEIGGDNYARSGNLGLLDQIQASKWVGENIAGFGGDPDNMTIFGESASGTSVISLMIAPEARGLFHRAILESPVVTASPEKTAAGITRKGMEFAGAGDLQALRKLNTKQVLDATISRYTEVLGTGSFGPVIDGVVIPDDPLRLLPQQKGLTVPAMIGTTHDELRCFLFFTPKLEARSVQFYRDWLNERSCSTSPLSRATWSPLRPACNRWSRIPTCGPMCPD